MRRRYYREHLIISETEKNKLKNRSKYLYITWKFAELAISNTCSDDNKSLYDIYTINNVQQNIRFNKSDHCFSKFVVCLQR
jgi:hypothetical protein